MFNNPQPPPEQLTILYDSSCGFCVSCRRWLERQPSYVPLQFLPAGGAASMALYPELASSAPEELTVVSADGLVYRGASAWITCLWALCDFREWAYRLSSPALLPFARQAFELLSRNRKALSTTFGLMPESELLDTLRAAPAASCGMRPLAQPPHDIAAPDGSRVLRIVLLAILGWLAWTLFRTYREPLLFAAFNRGIVTNASTLQRFGFDVERAFLRAAREGDRERVQAFLSAGVKPPMANGFFRNALATAALAGKTEVVTLLRSTGFDADARDGMGRTALMVAASQGKSEPVRRLLVTGADPDAVDNRNQTPLLLAARSSADLDVVQDLLHAGARVDAADTAGDTPLMAAADRGSTATVCALLEAGADPNTQDSLGRSALLRLTLNAREAAHSTDTLQALLAAGANPLLPDREGLTAHGLASRSRDPNMRRLFGISEGDEPAPVPGTRQRRR